MNRIVFCLSFLVSALGAWSGAQAQALQPAQPLDRIVAVADDSVILQSELDAAVANVLNQYRANPQQLPPRDVLERQVLESLIAVLDRDTMPDKSSNPAAALALAGQMLDGLDRGDLVLISDGGGVDAAALAEAQRLGAAGVQVQALSVAGDPAGDAGALSQIARRVVPADAPGPVIAALSRARISDDAALRALQYRDLGPWLAALALIPLLWQFRRQA